jgi:hypothetical protein
MWNLKQWQIEAYYYIVQKPVKPGKWQIEAYYYIVRQW